MIMILFPTYQVVGSFALLYFIMARMLIIFFFGMQLAYIVQLANHESLKHKNKLPMYVFLLLSSEIGILVSIFVNRLMISHGVSLVHFEDALRLQLLLNMILVVACLKLKSMNKFNEQLGFNFRRDKLYVLIKHNYKYIFLRTVLISYSALLMVMVIIRIPNTLHVYWGWTQNNVNVVTIQITVLGFIGSYLMKICTKYLNPARLMMIMYLISVVENIIYLYGNLLFAGTFNYYWLLSMGLFYGAFLRLTPLILFDMKDFNPRQQLIGRFISFLLAYVVVIGITLFFIDASYFVYQSDRVPTVLYTLVIVAIFGIISLWAKSKYYANL
jgi:hypothetical protein